MVAYPVEHDDAHGTARFRSKPVSAVQRKEACTLAIEAVGSAGSGALTSPLGTGAARLTERRNSGVHSPLDPAVAAGGGGADPDGPSSYSTHLLGWQPSKTHPLRFYSLVVVSKVRTAPGGSAGSAGSVNTAAGSAAATGAATPPSPTRGGGGSAAGRLKPRRGSATDVGAVTIACWLVVQTWEIEQVGVSSPLVRRAGFGTLLVSQSATALDADAVGLNRPDGSSAAASGSASAKPGGSGRVSVGGSGGGSGSSGGLGGSDGLGLSTWVSVVFVSPDCVPGVSAVECAALYSGRCAVRLSASAVTVFPRVQVWQPRTVPCCFV